MAKILIIEDDANILFLLEEELGLEGHDVASALDGKTGLTLIQRQPPELVIVDLMMPGMSGEQVLRHIKKSNPTLPVIIHSAYSSRSQKMAHLKPDATITKSADFSGLKAAIASLCPA